MTDEPATDDRVPDLLVEKLALGELPEDQAAAVRTRLGDDAEPRLAALAVSDRDILDEHPPAQVAADVHRRLARLEDQESRSRGSTWLMWAPVAAAAGVALMWWVGRDGPTPDAGGPSDPPVIAKADTTPASDAEGPVDDGPDTIRFKGDPVLMVDRIVSGRPERMNAETTVAAGDLLQVRYNAKGAQQGVVVSVDGAGVATLHFPASQSDDPRLAQAGPTPLPESYELDDAPGFERFFFVTVDVTEPRLDVARVMDAARTLAAGPNARDGELALPEDWRQQSIRLLK